MHFLFPSFLWGLLAVLLPIAIHLFNFRRTRRVHFTKVAFLKDVKTRTSSIRRLKHWLVLAMRCLAIAALVVAFAQPIIPAEGDTIRDRQGLWSIYLDNSYSMQNEENGKRYLDIATGRLSDLLGLFSRSASLQLITNDFDAQEQSLSQADKIRDRLTTLGLSPTPRTLAEVYQRQRNLAARHAEPVGNQFFWLSDFQKSTVGNLSDLSIDTTDHLVIVPVQAAVQKNVFVDSVWLNTPFIRELQNNILYVKVSNSGTERVDNQIIKLNIDGTQVSTASVALPAKGSATAKFNFSTVGRGYKKGHISFDDFPVTFDNDYYFVLNASPVINIVHLTSGTVPGVNFVGSVYQNDSLFSIRSFNVQNVDVGVITSADLIVMEGVGDLSGSLSTALKEFVRRGGSLAIIPPASPDVSRYTTFMGNLGISGLTSKDDPSVRPIPISPPDRNNPFFSDVFEESVRADANLNLPSALPVWRWNSVGSTLLSLRDGQPYLSLSAAGKGKVYIFGAPLTEAFGTMAQHALFVPVMYKMAAMSVREQQTAHTFGERSIVLTVSDPTPNSIYKLRMGKTELIPVQRINGNQLTLELPKADQVVAGQSIGAGYYEVVKEGKTEQLLALNHDNTESRLDYYTSKELRTLFSGKRNIEVFDKLDDGKFVREFEKQNLGTSLWKYFLYAALAFFLLEILFIRFLKS